MPPSERRSYTSVERAEAVGLTLSIGSKAAASRLGIPRRTLSYWIAKGGDPVVSRVIEATRSDVAARLWEAVTAGTDAVLEGLRDPKARLGDKASALRIVVEAHALITGGPTARTESKVQTLPAMTWEQTAALADWIDKLEGSTDDELRTWLISGGADEIRDSGTGSGSDV